VLNIPHQEVYFLVGYIFVKERNQITIWDERVLKKDMDKHYLKLENVTAEYSITDVYGRLAGSNIQVYLNYEHMPIIGLNYKERVFVGNFTLPKKFTGIKKND